MPEASFFLAANLLAAILFAFIVPSKSTNPISAAAIFGFVTGGDIFNHNYLVWGNYYEERSVSANLRENYLTTSANIIVLQSNMGDYVLLNSCIDYLNYSKI
jgi:hypothetical protein